MCCRSRLSCNKCRTSSRPCLTRSSGGISCLFELKCHWNSSPSKSTHFFTVRLHHSPRLGNCFSPSASSVVWAVAAVLFVKKDDAARFLILRDLTDLCMNFMSSGVSYVPELLLHSMRWARASTTWRRTLQTWWPRQASRRLRQLLKRPKRVKAHNKGGKKVLHMHTPEIPENVKLLNVSKWISA